MALENLNKNSMEIYINNLSKKFGEKTALSISELKIESGDLVGVVGNNGAGKTTMFRLLLDLLKADSGNVMLDNYNVAKQDEWKLNTGSYIEGRFLIDFFYPEEYFYFVGNAYGLSKKEVDDRLIMYKSFMNDEILKQNKYIKHFSAGNKQKIGIIGAMMINSKILILDEPFNFLDPTSQLVIKKMLQKMNEELGTTILISSHNLQHIMDISSRVLLLEKGLILKDIDNIDDEAKLELDNYFDLNE